MLPGGAVYTVLSEDELCGFAEDTVEGVRKKVRIFWDNAEDAVYNNLTYKTRRVVPVSVIRAQKGFLAL
jgi:hypothetical protein